MREASCYGAHIVAVFGDQERRLEGREDFWIKNETKERTSVSKLDIQGKLG
jgi:hypothetical protein